MLAVLWMVVLGFVSGYGEYSISLEPVSSVFLPSSERTWGLEAIEEGSYDAENKLLYVVGGLYRFVIDMRNPQNLAPLRTDMSPQGNLEYSDISVCGNYFIQTTDNVGYKPNGTVEIFKTFDASTPTERVFSSQVGEGPVSVKFFPGCRVAVVAVRAEGYGRGSTFTDPKGKILIVRLPGRRYPGTFADNVHITTLDFTQFDKSIDDLEKRGVRFVYRENNNSFSNDVDPRMVALSPHGNLAYINLQRTNAIAVVDVAAGTIMDIFGLGMKNWLNLKLDASDQDGGNLIMKAPRGNRHISLDYVSMVDMTQMLSRTLGKTDTTLNVKNDKYYDIVGIRMRHWPIHSYYQPDGMEFLLHGGRSYIVTANEGDEYDYSDEIGWSEVKTGREFVEQNMTADDLSDDMKTWLSNDTMLGRLSFTTQNGEDNLNGYMKFVMFGGRSFSIWGATSMNLVYDSGDDIATKHAVLFPDLFNCDVNKTNRPRDDTDKESPKLGSSPGCIAVGNIGRLSLIFIGNESPGTLAVYSVLDDVSKPRFEFLWQGIKNTTVTWEEMFNNDDMRAVDPERIIFLSENRSPTGKPAIIVLSSQSASVTLFNVILTGTVPPAPSQACAASKSILVVTGVLILNIFIKLLF